MKRGGVCMPSPPSHRVTAESAPCLREGAHHTLSGSEYVHKARNNNYNSNNSHDNKSQHSSNNNNNNNRSNHTATMVNKKINQPSACRRGTRGGDLIPSSSSITDKSVSRAAQTSRVAGGTIVGTLSRPTVPRRNGGAVEIIFRPSYQRAFLPHDIHRTTTHESATVHPSFYDELIHAVLCPAPSTCVNSTAPVTKSTTASVEAGCGDDIGNGDDARKEGSTCATSAVLASCQFQSLAMPESDDHPTAHYATTTTTTNNSHNKDEDNGADVYRTAHVSSSSSTSSLNSPCGTLPHDMHHRRIPHHYPVDAQDASRGALADALFPLSILPVPREVISSTWSNTVWAAADAHNTPHTNWLSRAGAASSSMSMSLSSPMNTNTSMSYGNPLTTACHSCTVAVSALMDSVAHVWADRNNNSANNNNNNNSSGGSNDLAAVTVLSNRRAMRAVFDHTFSRAVGAWTEPNTPRCKGLDEEREGESRADKTEAWVRAGVSVPACGQKVEESCAGDGRDDDLYKKGEHTDNNVCTNTRDNHGSVNDGTSNEKEANDEDYTHVQPDRASVASATSTTCDAGKGDAHGKARANHMTTPDSLVLLVRRVGPMLVIDASTSLTLTMPPEEEEEEEESDHKEAKEKEEEKDEYDVCECSRKDGHDTEHSTRCAHTNHKDRAPCVSCPEKASAKHAMGSAELMLTKAHDCCSMARVPKGLLRTLLQQQQQQQQQQRAAAAALAAGGAAHAPILCPPVSHINGAQQPNPQGINGQVRAHTNDNSNHNKDDDHDNDGYSHTCTAPECTPMRSLGRESVYDGYSHILRLDTGRRLVFVGMDTPLVTPALTTTPRDHTTSPLLPDACSTMGKQNNLSETAVDAPTRTVDCQNKDDCDDEDSTTTNNNSSMNKSNDDDRNSIDGSSNGNNSNALTQGTLPVNESMTSLHPPAAPHTLSSSSRAAPILPPDSLVAAAAAAAHVPSLIRLPNHHHHHNEDSGEATQHEPLAGLTAATRATLGCWFDATLADVPHVAVYHHRAGDVLERCEMKRVKELLEPREKAMADVGLQFLLDVLEWLVRHCVRENKTYIVVGGHGSGYLELYEVPADVEQKACPCNESERGCYSGSEGMNESEEDEEQKEKEDGNVRTVYADGIANSNRRPRRHSRLGSAHSSRREGGAAAADTSTESAKSREHHVRRDEELNLSLARMCLGMTRHLLAQPSHNNSNDTSSNKTGPLSGRAGKTRLEARGVKDTSALLLRSFMVFIQHMSQPDMRDTLRETAALLPRLVHRWMTFATNDAYDVCYSAEAVRASATRKGQRRQARRGGGVVSSSSMGMCDIRDAARMNDNDDATMSNDEQANNPNNNNNNNNNTDSTNGNNCKSNTGSTFATTTTTNDNVNFNGSKDCSVNVATCKSDVSDTFGAHTMDRVTSHALWAASEAVVRVYESARETIRTVETRLWLAQRGLQRTHSTHADTADHHIANESAETGEHSDEVRMACVHTIHGCLVSCVRARMTLIAWALRGCMWLSSAVGMEPEHVTNSVETSSTHVDKECATPSAAEKETKLATGEVRTDASVSSGCVSPSAPMMSGKREEELMKRLLCDCVCAGLQGLEELLYALHDSVQSEENAHTSTTTNDNDDTNSNECSHDKSSAMHSMRASETVTCRTLVDPREAIPWPALRGAFYTLHGDVASWAMRYATAGAQESAAIDPNAPALWSSSKPSRCVARMQAVVWALLKASAEYGTRPISAETKTPATHCNTLRWLAAPFVNTSAETTNNIIINNNTNGNNNNNNNNGGATSPGTGNKSSDNNDTDHKEACTIDTNTCSGGSHLSSSTPTMYSMRIILLSAAALRFYARAASEGCDVALKTCRIHLYFAILYRQNKRHTKALESLNSAKQCLTNAVDAQAAAAAAAVSSHPSRRSTHADKQSIDEKDDNNNDNTNVFSLDTEDEELLEDEVSTRMTGLTAPARPAHTHTALATALRVCVSRELGDCYTDLVRARERLQSVMHTAITATMVIHPPHTPSHTHTHTPVPPPSGGSPLSMVIPTAVQPLCVGPCRRVALEDDERFIRAALEAYGETAALAAGLPPAPLTATRLSQCINGWWLHEAGRSSRAARPCRVRMLLTLVGAQLDRQLRRGQPVPGGLCATLYQSLREIRQSGALLWSDANVGCTVKQEENNKRAAGTTWGDATTREAKQAPHVAGQAKHVQLVQVQTQSNKVKKQQCKGAQPYALLHRLTHICPMHRAGAWELLRLYTATAIEAVVPEEMRVEVAAVTTGWTRAVRECWWAMEARAEETDVINAKMSSDCSRNNNNNNNNNNSNNSKQNNDNSNSSTNNNNNKDDMNHANSNDNSISRSYNEDDNSIATVTEWCVQLALVHCVALERATTAVGGVHSGSVNTVGKSAARRARGKTSTCHTHHDGDSEEDMWHSNENDKNKNRIQGNKKSSKNSTHNSNNNHNNHNSSSKHNKKGASASSGAVVNHSTSSNNTLNDTLSGDDVTRRVADMTMLLSVALSGDDALSRSGAGTMYTCWRLHAMIPWVCVMCTRMMQRSLRLAMARVTEHGRDDDAAEVLDGLIALEKKVMLRMICESMAQCTTALTTDETSGASEKDAVGCSSAEVAQILRSLLRPLTRW